MKYLKIQHLFLRIDPSATRSDFFQLCFLVSYVFDCLDKRFLNIQFLQIFGMTIILCVSKHFLNYFRYNIDL